MNVLSHRFCTLLGCAALSLATATTASAQEKSPEPRFQETFEPAGAGEKVRLTVEPTVAKDTWEVHIASEGESGATQLREKLPRWIFADHYGFEVATEELDDGVSAVMFAALPGVNGDGPPSATQFQVVWAVEEKRNKLRWTRVDTAQYSSLDGGQRLAFEKARTKKGKSQLVRRRRGSDSIFCGSPTDAPVLFDLYEPDSGTFTQKLDIDRLLKDAPTLNAKKPDAEFQPPSLQAWYQWFAASSDRRSPNRRGALIRPLELGDHKVNTAWMEGVDGLGRGEFVSAQLNDAVALESIRILPGLGGSKALFEAFARPTRVLVGLSDGSRFVIDLGRVSREQIDNGRGVLVELPKPIESRCMSVMLLDSTRGKRVSGQPSWTRDTAIIAEITPYSELHAKDAKATARRIVERISTEKNARARQRISELALSLEDELVSVVRQAVAEGTPEERRRIIPLMASLPAEEAVPMLIKFLRESDPADAEYRAVKRSLAAHYAEAAPGLIAFLGEDAPDKDRKHTDVLRLLGRVGQPAHLNQLVEHLGQGSRSVRNERIRAIGSGGRPLVEPLLVYAHANINTEGGYDALKALNLLGKRLHFNGLGELPRPELFEPMLDKVESRRTLLRALRVAKFFRAQGFLDTVKRKFADHEDALVRRAAIAAIERYPSAEARNLLVDALSDSSPDVRITAVSALAERDDASEVVSEVLAYSREESWKAGLQQAFRVLAAVETDETDAAFEKLFLDKPNTTASLLAAQALDRAGRPVKAEVAQRLVENPEVNLDLRLEMLDLLGVDRSQTGETFLLATLTEQKWEQFAKPTRSKHKLRDHVLLALGRRRSEAAMPKLLELAQTSTSLDVQQVALRALAFYQDEGLLTSLKVWKKSADPKLRTLIEDTITMIERRRTLTSVRQDIDDVLEGDEESESDSADNASKQPDTE
ncbi:hypothetical protein FIV42_28190 [Persicimonas caeni]|uniref:NAD glycohydrolase translocation F5/8 type C domain-containing protein n=1 Tax=Persicimonas caeni TaxID=2292766 RepID=A0A4Y6Q3A4_PERCE|nr:HEAT repeat domain-containing protein [Persicimonas caeni]QDG54485.1 hypothetical protein FIV42_28190 [Persicimonas caeni]QED35706.1 hypothetical protein FRD00_28185 [Persicimonas caeni]